MTTKLEQLKQKQSALIARIKQEEAKQKTRTRKEETRMKILLGAMLLEEMKSSTKTNEEIRERLKSYLTKEHDRQLFKL
jgi:large subunit ribosomal protein L7/L12